MQLKTIIYTTSRSLWIKSEFEKIYKTIRRSKAVTVYDFKVKYFKLPAYVPTYTRSSGGVYIDWGWFRESLPEDGNNAVCLHITRRERDDIGMKHSAPGKSLGGVFDRSSQDNTFRFVVIANKNSQSYDEMSSFERIFIHELSHGFSFWRRVVDLTHIFDYRFKNIKGLFFLHDFTYWNSLVSQVKALQERLAFLLSLKNTLHAPIDIPFMSQITQPFGVRNSIYPLTGHHVGTDFGIPVGENCYALTDGYVVKVRENHPTLGNATYFKFKWKGQYYTARYLHQSRPGTMGFKKRGANVGVTGNTGLSTGPHLHFDISRGDFNLFGINGQNFRDKFINPMSFEYEGVKK